MHSASWLIVGILAAVVVSALVTLGALLLDWYCRYRNGRQARVKALFSRKAAARHRIFMQQGIKKPPGEAA